jgi:hypothetical protein
VSNAVLEDSKQDLPTEPKYYIIYEENERRRQKTLRDGCMMLSTFWWPWTFSAKKNVM